LNCQFLLQALDHYAARYRDDPTAALEAVGQGESARDPKLEPENCAYAAVASVILNLDEVITKE